MHFNAYFFLALIFCEALEISSACPESCQCGQDGVNVNCLSKKLKDVPDNIPMNAVSLDLSRNFISNINNDSFSLLSELVELRLSNNRISTISPMAFAGLTSLENLYMVHCGLSNWHKDLLSSLSKLTSLYLTDNEFKTIPNITSPSLSRLFLDKNKLTSLLFPDDFQWNENLQSVVLSNHNISQINDDDFMALKDLSIKSLKLSDCRIKTISSKALSHLTELKTLDLNSNGLVLSQLDSVLSQISKKLETLSVNKNNIETLTANTFAGFANGTLNILQMDGNPLKFIDPQAFAPLTRLTRLSLRDCKLSSFGSALQPLTRLTALMLSNNPLSEVPKFIPRTLQFFHMSSSKLRVLSSHALKNANNLRELIISNSGLETVESEAFTVVESSKTVVDFSDNFFKCDCSLAWFRNWLNETKVTVKNVEQYLCGSPETLKGKPLFSFSTANCSLPLSHVISSLISTSTYHSESTLSGTEKVLIGISCSVVVVAILFCILVIRHYVNKRNRLQIKCYENEEAF